MIPVRHVLLAVLLLAIPSVAQYEEPSFTINSNETYHPGQKPQIAVWAHNVKSLEFRVYRVNDPVRFFAQLQEQHRFGGRGPRVGHERTWLERFHTWKHRIWAWVRDFFRAQFSPESRTQIRDWRLERHVQSVSKVESFAQVPLLNRQQLVSAWQWTSQPGAERWRSEAVPIPVQEAGVYLVEATDGNLRAYTVVIISEIALITKTSPGQVLAFVVDRTSGAPVRKATVLLWINRQEIGRAVSDDSGLVKFPANVVSPEDVSVLVIDGERFAINAPWAWGLSSDPEQRMQAYGYTDRPVYRPGDTMHYKLIVRSRTPEGFALPKTREIRLRMNDASGNARLEKTATLSEMGTVAGDFNIPADAPLGYWYLQAQVGEKQLEGVTFFVEEYKKPEYQVRVTMQTARVLQGQPIRATIDARYYFGEPVANAKVTWVVHRSTWWAPGRYTDDEEQTADEGESEEGGVEYDYAGEQTSEKSGALDADGKLQIVVPTTVSDKKQDTRYRIEARVTDPGNREIAGAGHAVATYGSYYLSALPDSYVYKPGDIAKIAVQARDYEGHPIQTSIHAELSRWTWQARDKEQIIWAADATTDASGNGNVQVSLPSGGEFRLRVTSHSPEGRDIETHTYLWVSGAMSWWGGGRGERLKIVTDKKEYKPGDVAHVLVMVPEASYVLLTVEGSYLYSQQVLRNDGGTVAFDVPIKSEYEPNVYIGAAYIVKNKFYQGQKILLVPATEKNLDVEVRPAKPQYQPGDAAVYTIRAHDSFGKPVEGEFSLGVVDEAIYAIRPELARNIFSEFYGRTYDAVNTQTSLTYYFSGSAGKRKMQLADLRPNRSLAQLKPERLVQPKIRRAFPDTAYWIADVRTDPHGEAQARFTFPDALTTWRATTRGITRDTRVGSAVDKTIVRKNLMVRLVVPRFFRQGDELTVSTIVHNYLTTDKHARVSMEFDGLQVVDGTTHDVDVASRGDTKVDWRVRVLNASQARVLGKALTNEESDAMELTLPIEPFGVKLANARAGVIAGDGDQTGSVSFPANTEPGSRSLQISVTPSIAGAIFNALEFLTSYPYGCTEQTMSSFLPNVIVSKTMKELGIRSNVNSAELQKKTRAGLERLYEYQHPDGAWGWWKTDDDNEFMTAYVLVGLGQARDAGYDVRSDVLSRAQNWLRTTAQGDKRLAADLRAYMAHALAASGTPDAKALEAAWKESGSMTAYGKSVLGLAFKQVSDNRAEQIASDLEHEVKSNDQEAWWESNYDWLLDFSTDASAEATAYALKLLTAVHPNSPLLPKAAQYLVDHRNEGYYWTSTKQTAMVIYGLTDYIKQSGELGGDFTVQVTAGDRQILSKHFTPADANLPATVITLPEAQLSSGENNVRFTKRGKGRLYWSARAEYYSADKKLTNTGSQQLSAVREYFRLTPVQQSDHIVYHLDSLPSTLAVGDVIAVRLTVGGSDWRYLMIEDPLPAGTESIQRDDLYQLDTKPSWWSWWFTERELHDNRTTFFQTWFSQGQHEYVYLLKVVNPGEFKISPARVQPMYQPEYMATTEARTVSVK